MKRVFKRRDRSAKTPPSSKSKTSISETTEQLMGYWRHRFGRAAGDCSECEETVPCSGDACSDSLCRVAVPSFSWGTHEGDSLLRSRFAEHFDVTNQVEFTSCSSSAFIFTLMALVSAFLVVSVTVILLRVDPIVNPVGLKKEAEPALAPRDFTLPPRKVDTTSHRKRSAHRTTRSVEHIASRAFLQTRKHTASKLSPLQPFTAQETSAITQANLSRRSAPRKNATNIRVTLPDSYTEEVARMCSTVLYSYCSRRRQEFHYETASNSCVVASVDTTVLCNHSPNRFTSQKNCQAKCIDNSNPSERCFSTAMFSVCTSRDVRHQWWFFDGVQCMPWDFPEGACPSVKTGGDLFTSSKECVSQCGTEDSLLEPCQPPKPGPCTAKQLRFPYFAMSSPEDRRVTCMRSSTSVLSGHRCLTGTNRFLTETSCLQTCSIRDRHLVGRKRFKGRHDDQDNGNWRSLSDVPKELFDEDFFGTQATAGKQLSVKD